MREESCSLDFLSSAISSSRGRRAPSINLGIDSSIYEIIDCNRSISSFTSDEIPSIIMKTTM